MDLYEYQARELFAKHGVPVLGGQIATTRSRPSRWPLSS